MDLQGLQKFTLLDYPGKVACTVFLGGCNFRCPFCHNGQLVEGDAPAQLSQEQLLTFLHKRQGLLDGVCVTGGEPLLRSDLDVLLGPIKQLGYLIKLDTNGAYPQRLRGLVEAGLVDYVAMDVKNSPSRYAQTAGVKQLKLPDICQSVNYLLSGAVEYEFRTTVVRQFHDKASFEELADWLAGAKRYFLQSFVDRDTVLQPGLQPFAPQELEEFVQLVRWKIPSVQLRGM